MKRMQAKVKLVHSLLRMSIIGKGDLDTVCKLNDFDHICRFLETKIGGMTKSEIKAAYFSKGKELYQEIPLLELDTCIKLVHNAGGVVILAHPGRIHKSTDELQELFTDLFDQGIDGIECYHPDNNESLSKLILEFGRKKGCILTGGSDLHSSKTDFRVQANEITRIWGE